MKRRKVKGRNINPRQEEEEEEEEDEEEEEEEEASWNEKERKKERKKDRKKERNVHLSKRTWIAIICLHKLRIKKYVHINR